jgi:membrane protease YdiL (CAAX protease family)
MIGVYLTLGLIAGVWTWVGQADFFYSWHRFSWPSLWGLVMAVLLVTLYSVVSQVITKLFAWAQELEKVLQQLLTPLSYFQIILISLLSGFMEEWFFRGVLFTHFGLIISSLIFGLCHLIPAPRIWLWSVWTFFIGIGFCFILEMSESLLLCALIHSGINAVGMILLNQKTFRNSANQALSRGF